MNIRRFQPRGDPNRFGASKSDKALNHPRAFLGFVLVIVLLDIATSSDVIRTLEESFVLYIIAYISRPYFGSIPLAVASGIEYVGLVCWMLLSMLWNITLMHLFNVTPDYIAVVTSSAISATTSAFGNLIAIASIEAVRSSLRT